MEPVIAEDPQYFDPLPKTRRFRNKGIRARIVGEADIVFGRRSSQGDDGDLPQQRIRFDFHQHFPTVHAGHFEVQQYYIRPGSGPPVGVFAFLKQIFEKLHAVAHAPQFVIEASIAKCVAHQLAILGIVVSHQNYTALGIGGHEGMINSE